MSQTRIMIPSIRDKPNDFAELFSIVNQMNNAPCNIVIDFSNCETLWPNALAVLGGAVRRAEFQGKIISFDWVSLANSSLNEVLSQNDFARTFGKKTRIPLKESIPYREDKVVDRNATMSSTMNSIMDYLSELWLGRGWVLVSFKLRNAIVGKVWEVYSNAFEHSNSKIGVFSCGEHIANDLVLSVVDFGQGIPEKVRSFLSEDPRSQNLDSINFLKWAFQRGHSTCTEGVARGLGLDLLKEFIELNHGKLEIYTNNVYVIIDNLGMKYEKIDVPFEGTVMHITLRCDENLYQFKHEENPQF